MLCTGSARPLRQQSPKCLYQGVGFARLRAKKNPLTLPALQPLHGKRILVTAPRQYASKLCGLLIEAGARPLWVPTIEISSLPDGQQLAQLDKALQTLHEFTHLAFTSKNGISAVLQRLELRHGENAQRFVRESHVKLCALGADQEALQSAGYQVDIVPEESSTQGLVRHLTALGQAAGARVLCPVPFVTGGLTEPAVVPRFLQALEDAGASAVRVDCYVTQQGVAAADILHEVALIQAGAVDAIVFTSTAEAQGLVAAVGGVDGLAALVADNQLLLAAHGPYTAAGVTSTTGLPVPCVGHRFVTFDGVVSALEEHFS